MPKSLSSNSHWNHQRPSRGWRRRDKRKNKKEVVEVPREPVPTTEHEEEIHIEERGSFDAYSEKLVLCPIVEETTSTPLKTESRGK